MFCQLIDNILFGGSFAIYLLILWKLPNDALPFQSSVRVYVCGHAVLLEAENKNAKLQLLFKWQPILQNQLWQIIGAHFPNRKRFCTSSVFSLKKCRGQEAEVWSWDFVAIAVVVRCLANPPLESWSPLPTPPFLLLPSLQSENFQNCNFSESLCGLLGMEHGEGRKGKSQGGKSKEEEKLLR